MYMVWKRSSGQIRVEHETFEQAKDEAMRLAEKHAGE